MKSIQFVNYALKLFRSNPTAKERYKGEIDWLNERKKLWSHDRIRIGVLGVTSSGKSTLINAILGMKLLSAAVKPTSGQLVNCYKDKKAQARITIGKTKEIVLTGKNLKLENIRKYSDENENKNNKENVKGITIAVPGFDLGENAELIDSAGLDAYKLEIHEKLTLEVMLPTIDVCLLVTTLKSNSDEKVRTVLNAVNNHNCPLLIVQNMLDSVQASPDGTKSKFVLAQEHKARLQKIINNSSIKDKASVKIVQMSAIIAEKERCSDTGAIKKISAKSLSRYQEFKQVCESMIKEEIPKLDEHRCKTIAVRYSELIESEEKALSGNIVENPVFKYEGFKEKIDKVIENTGFSLQEEFSALKNLSKTGGFSDSIVKRKVKECEKNISSIIANTGKFMEACSKKLNIDLRDLNKEINFEAIPEPKEVLATKTVKRKVEKKGFWAKVARGAGDLFGNDEWGYIYETETIQTVDEARTAEEILKYIKRASAVYFRTVSGWMENLDASRKKINKIIDDEYNIFLGRLKKIENEADIINILNSLKIKMKEIELFSADTNRDASAQPEATAVNIEPGKNEKQHNSINISNYQFGLYNLAKKLLLSMSKTVVEKSCKFVNAPELTVVLGWDIHYINHFLFRSFGFSLDEREANELEEKLQITVQDIICIYSPSQEKLKELTASKPPVSFFIMVNAQQDGSARNQIKKLELGRNLKPEDKVFFVIDNFKSLINSKAIGEMRKNIEEYYEEFGIIKQKGLIFINSNNPVYDIAFVQNQLEPCISHQEENAFLNKIKNQFKYLWDAKTAKNINELIRSNY